MSLLITLFSQKGKIKMNSYVRFPMTIHIYFFHPKLYDAETISHVLKNVINFV